MIRSRADKIFQMGITIIMVLVMIVTLYPLVLVVFNSISDATAVANGQVLWHPVRINFEAYQKVFENDDILTGYRNTIFYALLGTMINMVLTICAAYPLSRKKLHGRKAFNLFITFTMFFSGGMIPTYIVVQATGLIDTIWAMIIPTAMAVYNFVVMRSFFESLPEDIFEAASIDGANHLVTLFRIVLPLSKAGLAVIVLFYFVTHWNSYFNGLLYLNNKELYPMQLVLRNILLQNQLQDTGVDSMGRDAQLIGEVMKYAAIVVSSLPLMIIYPFLQKYFVQGVMVGAVKG
jgi:putative aldouronate transport system permease protein